MLISLILIVHITLAAGVIAGFVYRYILAFKNKEYPLTGRNALFAGTAGLIITGVFMAIIAKLPITSLCLDSLGIVVALLVMEVGLQKLSSRLATEKSKT